MIWINIMVITNIEMTTQYICIYKTTQYICISLQSQEIPNIPVFVLEILKKSEQILNNDWKFWTDSKHSEHWLNILSRFWTFWTVSEQIMNILNIDWKFWTYSEHVWTFWIVSEQILNVLNIAQFDDLLKQCPSKGDKYVIDEELQHTDHLFLGVAWGKIATKK